MEFYIKLGILLRYVTTIGTFSLLSFYKPFQQYRYILLPIVLTLLDCIDGFPLLNRQHCFKEFEYQYRDKLCDVLSYVLVFALFKLDKTILFFILYRIIGVLLFTFTKNTIWLILFFDFVKEMMVYLYLFDTYAYLPFFMLLKICFEYYWHHKFSIQEGNTEPEKL